jgi:4a-hydroxytetrahydrobiopterin dehydratase
MTYQYEKTSNNPRLDDDEIDERLEDLEGWSLGRGRARLSRSLQFEDFPAAIDFIRRVAEHADTLDHHPEITNVYNEVELVLTTPYAEGLSALDFELAERINREIE